MVVMSELVAGRELDALIAEKVMGWHRSDTLWRDSEDTACKYVNEDDSEDAEPGWEFRPSTELDSAWQVVEHLKGERYFWLGWHVRDRRFQWECRFAAPEQYAAFADTAPLAICRAALAAVEH